MEEQQNIDYHETEISIKELIEVIWRGKYLIALFTLIFLIIAIAGSVVYDKTNSQVATVAALQWTGVSKGEYPDGSRFDYNTAFESYVFSEAIENSGLSLDTISVRSNFKVTPIVPSSILAQIERSIEQGEEPLNYHASEFKIELDNGNLGISVEEGKILLNNIITQFRVDFERRFINKVQVYNILSEDIVEEDYLDVYDILVAQASVIEDAMTTRAQSGYFSPTLGVSFGDISARVDIIRQLYLDKIQSRVNAYVLTKDKDFLELNYQYKIETAQLKLDKAIKKEIELQLLLNNYDGTKTTLIIPGLIEDGTELDLDTYYNTLIESKIDLQNEIVDLGEDISYYQQQIQRLNGQDPTFTVTTAEQAEEAVKVEDSIDSAIFKLSKTIEDANIILREYTDYQTSNTIKPLMAPEYVSSVNTMLYAGVGLILGGMTGVMVVLIREYWDKEEQETS
ncbi:MAG: hypothetical protein K9L74_02400 [Candidatus Izimaplasma sp.]|nr:hypothetical protein [Candidatus Izimaplasma bacterium]